MSEGALLEGTVGVEGTGLPAPGRWVLDPDHTTVGFTARHLMVTKVRGRITDVSGEINVAERPEDSSVVVTMRAASLDSGSETRDEHLRSADFLDVESHPEITFRSTGVELLGGSELRVRGDLTVRDVTRPVVLHAEFIGLAGDPWGGRRIGFSATAEIDREDFGMTWNAALEGGGVLVSRRVGIEIDVQAVSRPEDPNA